ncbi:MAG: bL35 family ribosomal protein [Patescibacteria group bacterium]
MPKKKIKKSVSKRFKVTKTGKVLFSHQNKGHHKLIKSKSRLRRQKEPGVLRGKFAKKIKQMLGKA